VKPSSSRRRLVKDAEPEMADLVRLIWSEADLVALMRESPATRVVITMAEWERDGRPIRAVVDWPDDPLVTRTTVAYVAPESEADDLVNEAIAADADAVWAEVWAQLPVRYHVFYDGCMLVEHPHAPRTRGDSDELSPTAKGRLLYAEDLTEAEMEAIGREAGDDYERSTARLSQVSGDEPDDIPI
jgi:hypothetical protein